MIIEKGKSFWKKLGGLKLPVVIIASALLIAVVLVKTKDKAKPIVVEEKAWLVSVQNVAPAEWAPSLTLYGKVESLWTSSLTSGIAADVISVAVIAGNTVEKDALLVSLDDRDAKLQLMQSEAGVEQAEASIASEMVRYEADLKSLPREKQLQALAQKEVDRLQGLVKKNVTSQSALDTARQSVERQAISVNKMQQGVNDHEARLMSLHANLLKAQAQRDKAALELERATIRAPFDGRITEIFVAPGTRVRNGDRLLRIFDSNALVFKALIPNQYVARISKARRAGEELIVTGEIDGQQISAKLLSLSAEVLTSSGGVEGLFEIQGSDLILQQGRLAKIILTLPLQAGLIALPPEAIYGTSTVYRLSAENRLQRLPITRIGETEDEQGQPRILVKSGQLQRGDKVITTQLPSAVEGLLVELAE